MKYLKFQISSQLDLIEAAVSDLSTTLAVHINPLAVNRHNGIAINIEAISDVGSDTGITESYDQVRAN